MTPTENGFFGLGLAPKLLAILDANGFSTPTPIQKQAIPAALEGKDVIGIAQTGTGKTLAFGLPMLQRLAEKKGMGLILLPTRELAIQVEQSLHKIGRSFGLKTAVLIGGEPIGRQKNQLRNRPHILIATPGRLIDHIDQRTLSLSTVTVLVLDEADRMLDMGFAPQLKKIFETVPRARQTMLFSATMPSEIVIIAQKHMALPLRVEVAPPGTASTQVAQEIIFVHKDGKLDVLKTLIQEHKGSVLVFTRTKFGAKKVAQIVRGFGHSAAELHSNRSLSQRIEALEGFKRGKYRVLVATDIAARGIDVTGIELVVNYDLPANAEDYVHRIGRTGRASLTGKAVSLATPDQKRDVREIEHLIRKKLPVTEHKGVKANSAGAPLFVENFSEPERRFTPRTNYRKPFSSLKPSNGFTKKPFPSKTRPSRPSFGHKPSTTGFSPSRFPQDKPFSANSGRKPFGKFKKR